VSGAVAAVDMQGNAVADVRQLNLDDSPLFVTGPLTGLPRPAEAKETVLADSARDFSAQQGSQGWSYGVFIGQSTVFKPLGTCQTTDWTKAWTDKYPYVSLTKGDQHPSNEGQTPVSVVRRWQSDFAGPVRIAGQFRCGTQGDGVGVSIFSDGRRRFRKLLGGGNGNPVVETFDFVETVHPGSSIDFSVDPGPTVNINYDVTQVAVTITKESR